MDRTTLYFEDGKSDKIYCAAIEPKDDGYVVNFSYGRRGGNMTTGTKTKSPVPLNRQRPSTTSSSRKRRPKVTPIV